MRLVFYFVLLIVITLFYGCANSVNIEVSEIKSIRLEIDENEDLNHGSSFEIKVVAELKKGTEKNITKHPNLKIESKAVTQLNNSTYTISERPTDFSDTIYNIDISIHDKVSAFDTSDSLVLNYQGAININPSSHDGRDGVNRRKGGVTLFNRNGVVGQHGDPGLSGENGGHFTAYLWRQGSEVRLRIENDSTGTVWKYKSRSCDSIIIDISGGNGGDGSDGGEGGNGKNGKKGKAPGNGGNGGIGGNGGNGGEGGSILIFVHSNAEHLVNKISFLQKGGKAGKAGHGGIGGVSGKTIKGQDKGSTGTNGTSGRDGNDAVEGPKPVISIIDFDFKALN